MPIRSRPSSDHDTVPPARRKQAEAKHSKDYYDPEGDLEILSSDNVLFKLHAYRLQASSSVFRDMMKVGTEGIIELTDMDFETGEIISNLFDIMIKGDNIFDLSTSCDRKRVVQLAQKYDFTSELRTIKHHLQLALSEHDPKKRSPRAIFRIALMLDEHELCRRAIIKAGGANWKFTAGDEAGKEEQFGDSVKDAGVFDMTGWSLDALETAPIEIVWALLRASHKAPDMSSGKLQAEYDVTAANYARLMALKGAPKFA